MTRPITRGRGVRLIHAELRIGHANLIISLHTQ